MKLFIIFITAILLTLQGLAQDSTSGTDSTEGAKEKSTFTLGALYCNNADYYGQSAVQKLPYVAAAATYHFKSGLYFTGLAYRLLSDTGHSIASAGSLGAGFDFKIGKKLGIDMNYSHTFYPTLSPFLQASSPDNAGITLSYEAWLKPSLSIDYAFGESSDIFTTAGLSKAIDLGSFSSKDAISITPAFSVVGGTQHFYQTYIIKQKLADSLIGVIAGPFIGGQQPGSTIIKTTTTFSILSYNFKMPLDYSRVHYMIEASCQFSKLSENAEAGPGKLNSFYSLSFYYQF